MIPLGANFRSRWRPGYGTTGRRTGRGRGEIGRRSRLKICFPQGSVGSSPAVRTRLNRVTVAYLGAAPPIPSGRAACGHYALTIASQLLLLLRSTESRIAIEKVLAGCVIPGFQA